MALNTQHGFPAVAGFKVGILMLETQHVLLPGNVQNATSFRFPVVYEPVTGLSFAQLASGDPVGDDLIKQAVLRLQEKNVDVIMGACGSFAQWQTRITQYASVPVYASILTQVPFILSGLPQQNKLGIVFATKSAYTDRALKECHIYNTDRLVILGAEDVPSYQDFYGKGSDEVCAKFRQEFVQYLHDQKSENPEIGAWLFQCSELPVYAADVQNKTGLPVFDQTLLIEHLYNAVSRKAYS
ncbi:MAG TPA: hypothetical protein ENI91_09085 [Sphingomonadales bacterium]|nr:hypothetical protein [Sphingomonadales bacterium]